MFYKRNSFLKIQLIIDTSIAPINAAEKFATVKPAIYTPIYQNNMPFTMRENIPKVKIFNGNVSMFIIGLINILKRVRTAPTINETVRGLIEMPVTTLAVSKTAHESINQCKIVLIIKCINLKIMSITYRQLL